MAKSSRQKWLEATSTKTMNFQITKSYVAYWNIQFSISYNDSSEVGVLGSGSLTSESLTRASSNWLMMNKETRK
ncbi:hypothetical protein L2E82_40745 [Cichorium intybus]|uniref:Uncharacterized protein n=1 Tax=Cichorium intybus TaxID=13427 RepID=A0ACB9ALV3_CICIN|nr:hypothetical protein L2E82_40745 [Cichorium intybus]